MCLQEDRRHKNVKGSSFIVCLTMVTLILITTFRPHTAGFHQAILSVYWVGIFVPPWLLVIGVSLTLLKNCLQQEPHIKNVCIWKFYNPNHPPPSPNAPSSVKKMMVRPLRLRSHGTGWISDESLASWKFVRSNVLFTRNHADCTKFRRLAFQNFERQSRSQTFTRPGFKVWRPRR